MFCSVALRGNFLRMVEGGRNGGRGGNGVIFESKSANAMLRARKRGVGIVHVASRGIRLCPNLLH